MVPKFRAWHMPFGPKGPMQEMVHGKSSSILAFSEMSPDKYVVEQYTGLKDVNGKEIYEGDFVSLSPNLVCKVIFKKGKFKVVGESICLDLCDVIRDCKIVGNIKENSELLGE